MSDTESKDKRLPEGAGLAAESGRFRVFLGGEPMDGSGEFFYRKLDDSELECIIDDYPVYTRFDMFDASTWKEPTVEVGFEEVEPELDRVSFSSGDHIEFSLSADPVPNLPDDAKLPNLRVELLGFDHMETETEESGAR